MHANIPVVALAVALVSACSGTPPKESPGGLGQQAADITSDTQTLRAAQAAVNEVVRNTQDCPLVNQSLPGANAAIDEADSKVKTLAGKQSLDAMRKQLQRTAEACVGVQ